MTPQNGALILSGTQDFNFDFLFGSSWHTFQRLHALNSAVMLRGVCFFTYFKSAYDNSRYLAL